MSEVVDALNTQCFAPGSTRSAWMQPCRPLILRALVRERWPHAFAQHRSLWRRRSWIVWPRWCGPWNRLWPCPRTGAGPGPCP